MNGFRKAIAVCLIAVLGVVSFTSCGKEETKTVNAPKRTPLKGSVTMSVADGEAYEIVSKLSGDIKIDKVESQQDVISNIQKNKCDFAVLTPIEAARLYHQGGDIKVVTTLSLADWKIAMKDYEGQLDQEENMAQVSGRYMIGIKDDPNSDKANSNSSEMENETIANGVDGAIDIEEQEEIVELKEMSEEIFQTLMAKENLSAFDGQIDWKDVYEASDYLEGYKSIVIGNKNNVDKATAGIEGFTELYSLADVWSKEFGKEIPGYILVATDKFLEKRNYEVEGVLDIIADNLKDNQEISQLKLVAYNVSNRGVMLVRDLMEVLEKYNSDAIDGKEINKDFYWSNK